MTVNAEDTGEIFSAAAAEYLAVAPVVWDPGGRAAVELAAPAPGDRVLDACCGIGSSALPAARAVGPHGEVDAVDLAHGLLELGRRRASDEGLANVRFVRHDVTRWTAGSGGYDLVQCCYGVFLLPDMDAGTAHLAGLVRPGGRLAVAVWRRGALLDFGRALYEVAGRHRPRPDGAEPGPAPAAAAPIGRIDTPELLASWLGSFGLAEVTVRTVERAVPLDGELAWSVVLGSGFRGALAGLGEAAAEAVRAEFLALLAERGIRSLDLSTLVGAGIRR
ncbi:class I SAM-dependent methyltransferase [Allonocardiopsis opalescens]|uniref:Ubiquinone/menaquinone biosynthesis C-methylase UbiE n=1 Tax=Allonocardiopsis opalescens TaxID=1144618 RepID=A0A2T0Q1S7_9ACTN|nr:methyltransferase domain-containing protein [Allonocardiopsis opalescens]PRX97755.1 ubiquinone/menaquinone biosynthesis C-methylase UbiE [Allonocardiopsis opalescens]